MTLKIGDKIKVKEQDITGKIVRFDFGNKIVIIDDDYKMWAKNCDDGTLIYRKSEVRKI
jgi:hypothetical protein